MNEILLIGYIKHKQILTNKKGESQLKNNTINLNSQVTLTMKTPNKQT